MSIPRTARVHFVYQFIILIILILTASIFEALLEKRILFLALIPVFSYMMIVLLCCIELLPLPRWLFWIETQNETLSNQDLSTESQKTVSSERTRSPKESTTISTIPKRCRLCNTNKEIPRSSTSSDANTQTIYRNKYDIFKKVPLRRPESTRSCIFRDESSRFEADSREDLEVYKPPQSWRSLRNQKSSKSHSNLRSYCQPIEEVKETVSPTKVQNDEEPNENDLCDLTRSLSFPFRRRKLAGVKLENVTNDLNIPKMADWNAGDYFGPFSATIRRKSISTEAIDTELRLINQHYEQNAITQSMEYAKESVVQPAGSKKALKSSASFYKFRKGVANVFNKNR